MSVFFLRNQVINIIFWLYCLDQLGRQFDCVYAQLTAHHVEDLNTLFNILVYKIKFINKW